MLHNMSTNVGVYYREVQALKKEIHLFYLSLLAFHIHIYKMP